MHKIFGFALRAALDFSKFSLLGAHREPDISTGHVPPTKKPAEITLRGPIAIRANEDYSLLWRFLSAAPRMSPSEAPESDEPN